MLELGVEECLRWFQVNQMAINADKFQLMFLGAGETNFGLNICGTIVKSQHCVKLLGAEIDSSLRFDAHIRNICKKANTKIRCLQRIRNYVSVKQTEVLSSAYILSGFSYCPIIWMYSSKTLGLLIQKVQKRCLRTIHGQYDLSLSELLELSKTQSIHNRHLQAMLTEVYKSLNDLNPPFMKDYFKLKNISYSLRGTEILFLPPTCSATYGSNSIHFQACSLWKKLTSNVKLATSLSSFKNKLLKVSLRCSCRICKK